MHNHQQWPIFEGFNLNIFFAVVGEGFRQYFGRCQPGALLFLLHLHEFIRNSDDAMICDLEKPFAIPLHCCFCGTICCLFCGRYSKIELESLLADVEHFSDTYQCRCLQSIGIDHLQRHYRRCEDDLATL